MLIVLLGPPGSGKGTQSKLLSERYGLLHFSTGQMLRDEIQRKTPLGLLAGPPLAEGNFISDDIAIELISTRLQIGTDSIADEDPLKQGAILDGFPRTLKQAVEFDQILAQVNRSVTIAIELQVPDSVVRQRLSERFRTAKVARPEDSASAIPRRMEIYREATLPVAAYYRERQLLSSVDGVGTQMEILSRIEATIG